MTPPTAGLTAEARRAAVAPATSGHVFAALNRRITTWLTGPHCTAMQRRAIAAALLADLPPEE